jgi:hypothetical protein
MRRPMAKRNTTAELSEQLLQALREHRDTGQPYPTTVAELLARANPAGTPEQAERALSYRPSAPQLLRARKKDPASPIALAEDAERLAGSPLLLEYVLSRVCRADKPLHPAARLVKEVDAVLRPAFAAALERRLAEKFWPESVGVRAVKGKPHLYLHALPPPPPAKHPAEELGERLLEALQVRRDRDGDCPVPLNRLAAEAAPQATPAQLKQAATREPFRSQAVVAVAGKADSPVALAADRDRLAGSTQLLEYVLAAATTPRRPLAAPPRLQDLLADDLRAPFTESLRHRVEARQLPPSLDILTGIHGPELFLKERLAPAAALAWKMLRVLEGRREQAGTEPLTLEGLAGAADATAAPEVIAAALKDRTLKPHLVLALPGRAQTPVALAEDAGRLASWPGLLEAVLAAVRTPDNQAAAVKDLQKKVAKPLQSAFAASVERRLSEHALPAGVGLLRVKRSALLFLLADVSTSWPAEAAPAAAREAPPEDDFPRRFAEAFDRLDRARGGHNLVSLVALRAALGVDRATFDAQLGQLRRQGRYSLSAAEGRHGITAEEQGAGIVEDGSLLLFVSRKGP